MTSREIAEYAVLLLSQTQARYPLLHVVMPVGEQRDQVVAGILESLGGGHVVAPSRTSAVSPNFETVLSLLLRSPNVALEDLGTLRTFGINIEAVRLECVARRGTLVLVTDTAEGLADSGIEADPRAIVQFEVGDGELRIAPAADRARGFLRIPRDGGRPEFLAADRDLGARVSEHARKAINEAMDG